MMMMTLRWKTGASAATTVYRALSTAAAGGVVPLKVATQPLGVVGLPDDKQPHYGVITMSSPPANALNQAMIDHLHKALTDLEGNKRVRGLVLTSDVKGFFSAGIDLMVFKGTEADWKHYWMSLRELYLRLYTSRLVSIAAVNGHAPGGGTILSLACHYRFMTRNKATIGLNEVAVGLPVPKWITERAVQVVGHRAAERLLPLGAVIPAEEAEKIGLIDKSFDTTDDMQKAAVTQLQEACTKIEYAQQATFDILRHPHAAKMRADEVDDVTMSCRIVTSPKFQTALQALLDRIAAKKK